MSRSIDTIDITKLSLEVRAKLAEIDLEYSEGDLTAKGYEKKKSKLLEPFLSSPGKLIVDVKHGEVTTKCVKTTFLRETKKESSIAKHGSSNGKSSNKPVKSDSLTRNDGLFTSNAHSEAVQLALAQNKSKRIPILPLPVRRKPLSKNIHISLKTATEEQPSRSLAPTLAQPVLPSQIRLHNQMHGSSDLQLELRGALQSNERAKYDDAIPSKSRDIPKQRKADSMPREQTPGSRSLVQDPSSPTISTTSSLTRLPSPRPSSTSGDDRFEDDVAVPKVSAKIQQLLLTLKRPKKKPLVEYFQDDQDDLLGHALDENAPKPLGPLTSPFKSKPSQIMTNIPASLEAAIHRYGTSNPKAPCLTSLDQNGKSSYTLTYGKLFSRTRKVAYTLTHKRNNLQPGQRVALVFPNQESIAFTCVFHGCLLAGLVPVVVEVPQSSEDPGSTQLGFLLGSCAITVALTTEQCLKSLPKTEKGEVVHLKGWPRLQWILTDSKHLHKLPSNWEPSIRDRSHKLAYIEYKIGKEGSVVPVAHSKAAVYKHCRSLMEALTYDSNDVMVSLLDFRRGLGLVHGVIASVFSGMHVFSVPYSMTKHNPAQWLHVVTKSKATLALAKSRDLHWTLATQRDVSNINLQSMRLLVVSDGANPWSIASCDLFLSSYEKRGLARDVLCPCAWSSEALTVAIKRSGSAAVRTALSLNDLSFNVVREEKPNSQVPCIVLQDCGKILPGCAVTVVKCEGDPILCQTDEVGEILLSNANNDDEVESGYFGLAGVTEKTFKAHPIVDLEQEQAEGSPYTRTGLIGYLTADGRLLVTGLTEDIITISGRVHNANDVIATILAVEPIRFVYKSRIAVFSFSLLKDERLVVVAEQKPDSPEDLCNKWMTNVLQAVEGIHNVAVYCLCLLAPDGLPRTPLGNIDLSEVKNRFLEGSLHPRSVMMCPHQCVTNLPKPRQKHKDIGVASILQGQVVTGMKMSEARGKDLGDGSDDPAINFSSFSEILKWRAKSTPDNVLFAQIGSKGSISSQLSSSQLHKKAEKIAQLLLSYSTLSKGDQVALIFPAGLELIAAFYGCLYAGCVPVPIRAPSSKSINALLLTVRMITKVSKAVYVLSNSSIIKLLRSKEATATLHNSGSNTSWPPMLDIDDAPKKKVPVTYKPPTAELLAYLDFSVTNAGTLVGVKMSHYSCSQLSRAIKIQCNLSPMDSVGLCLDPYSGLGFVLLCLSSVYSGHRTIFIPPNELDVNPHLWLNAVALNKVQDIYLSYTVVESTTKEFAANPSLLQNRNMNLNQIKSCVIVSEERPRVALINNFTKFCQSLGLSPQAVSTSFACRVSMAICLQGYKSPELNSIYVSAKSLRTDRIALVEKGSPHSLCLFESGKVLPGSKVIIVDPETLLQCSNSSLGEIWVSSPYMAQGYYAVRGGDANMSYQDHFQSTLKTGDTRTNYARTGYLGFLKKSERISLTDDDPQSLYVVGTLSESIEVRGMRYHPIDIENSVVRCSSKVSECVVFDSNNILVVIVELVGVESSALDLVPLVTNIILEEHYLIAGVVAITDPGSIPFNSRGEKQRMHMEDAFLQDRLDPIYVAYNT